MTEFNVRELEEKDMENNFLETLNHLRPVGNLDSDAAKKISQSIKNNPLHKIFVAVNNDGKIIGSVTLFMEQKFIHEGGLAAHIEDVVTHKDFRRQGVATALMGRAIEFARWAGCYKIVLDCSEENVPFYEKAGFKRHEVCMKLSLGNIKSEKELKSK